MIWFDPLWRDEHFLRAHFRPVHFVIEFPTYLRLSSTHASFKPSIQWFSLCSNNHSLTSRLLLFTFFVLNSFSPFAFQRYYGRTWKFMGYIHFIYIITAPSLTWQVHWPLEETYIYLKETSSKMFWVTEVMSKEPLFDTHYFTPFGKFKFLICWFRINLKITKQLFKTIRT